MASCSIGFVPSMSEGFCYTAVQMQAMGLSLIVSDVGALPEVLSDHHQFVWYGQIAELNTAIHTVLDNQILSKLILSNPISSPIDQTTTINYQEYCNIFERYQA
jgi:glycosyltransferase involved in cell wall biosynthesis